MVEGRWEVKQVINKKGFLAIKKTFIPKEDPLDRYYRILASFYEQKEQVNNAK